MIKCYILNMGINDYLRVPYAVKKMLYNLIKDKKTI